MAVFTFDVALSESIKLVISARLTARNQLALKGCGLER